MSQLLVPSYMLTICVIQAHTGDAADLTQSIAGFEDSIRRCKAYCLTV